MYSFDILWVVEFSKTSKTITSRLPTSGRRKMESSTPSLFENAFQRRSQPLNKNIGIVHLSDEDVGCFLILLIK